MKLGEFREKTKDLPDDTDMLMEAEEHMQYNEMFFRWILPPVLDHPYVVLFEGGQIWNYELDLDARIDARLDL